MATIKVKKLTVSLIVLMLSQIAVSEMRTWTTAKGASYTAEYVAELFGKVTLRDAAGKEVRIPVDEFSEHDQKYLRVMVPPEMEIKFDKKNNVFPPRKMIGERFNERASIESRATVRKISSRLFTSSLNLEIFLVGTAIENRSYILLSKSDFKFLFGPEAGSTREFKLDPVVIADFIDDTHFSHRGERYLGYVAVISDARGNIVKTQTDIDAWIESPAVIEELRKLAVRGAPSLRSRYFDKTGRKVDPPRTQYYTERLRY